MHVSFIKPRQVKCNRKFTFYHQKLLEIFDDVTSHCRFSPQLLTHVLNMNVSSVPCHVQFCEMRVSFIEPPQVKCNGKFTFHEQKHLEIFDVTSCFGSSPGNPRAHAPHEMMLCEN